LFILYDIESVIYRSLCATQHYKFKACLEAVAGRHPTLGDFNFRWAESLIVFAQWVLLIWTQKLPISRSSD